jgi:hypothetical protein
MNVQDSLVDASPRPGIFRVFFGLCILGAWSWGMVLLARFGGPVAAIAGLLFTVPLTSLGEWLVHGVLYHNPLPGLRFIRQIHHQGHHKALFPPRRYTQAGRFQFMRFRKPYLPFRMSDNAVDDALTRWSQIALHFVAGIPLILVPAWTATHSPPFVLGALATLTGISWLLAHVHGVIHTPGDRWIEHQRWFQWLDRHHYIHHVDMAANINFLLPICDFLFGTQKWQMTADEQARQLSFADAKPMAKDVHKPADRLRNVA